MSATGEVLVGLAILIGLVGVIVPVLPGVLLILAAIGVWAFVTGGTTAWTVFAVCATLLVITGVVKYTWPGRKMQVAGVPTRSIVLGAVLGIVGFFVIPVIGLLLGFVLGVYVSELQRLGNHQRAWPSTIEALKGVGLSILVELFGALLAAGIWLAAAIVV
ncbi:DUF456 domain-containing protein [Nocardia sp. 2]|uniref:DUF456 domain-containing protein n=1 Tax=Nocardia acididurans TaxID=2802282 RepID=A0ABS1LXJ1_9NOCA|nr:DUF456 domain-containing protein [Nocardia acididurans]MBL1072860.1 DUF456 domain-containing protein [Nocardia acididurans]